MASSTPMPRWPELLLIVLTCSVAATFAAAQGRDINHVFGGRHGGRAVQQAAEIPCPHGPGISKMLLNRRQLNNGLTYLPAAERLRVKLDKLLKGERIKITTVGGSIMSGQGSGNCPNLPENIFNWFNDTFPQQVTWHSGAIPGTMSSYMSVCHNIHIPKDSDIIFVEYSVNDWHHPPGPPMQNDVRRAFERLLRKLLNLPSQPAVILIHSFMWNQQHPVAGSFWGNCERDFSEFERFYFLPSVSVKAAVFHELAENTKPGFIRDKTQLQHPELTGQLFYYDPMHPSGATGARMTAELAMHLIAKVIDDLKRNPVTAEERAYVAEPLPPPMIPGNYESLSDKCFIGQLFTTAVTEKRGFEWINESKTIRPKWGMVATEKGSVLHIRIDTRATKTDAPTTQVLVQLAYLRSYSGMGEAKISCVSGCTCDETVLQGHQTIRQSQLNLHNFHASQSPECVVAVTVLDTTKSGGHKVKIAGVMVSEEAGAAEGIRNEMAVEYVHDISMRGAQLGVFEARNHA